MARRRRDAEKHAENPGNRLSAPSRLRASASPAPLPPLRLSPRFLRSLRVSAVNPRRRSSPTSPRFLRASFASPRLRVPYISPSTPPFSAFSPPPPRLRGEPAAPPLLPAAFSLRSAFLCGSSASPRLRVPDTSPSTPPFSALSPLPPCLRGEPAPAISPASPSFSALPSRLRVSATNTRPQSSPTSLPLLRLSPRFLRPLRVSPETSGKSFIFSGRK